MKKKREKKLIFIENLIDNEGNWLIIKKYYVLFYMGIWFIFDESFILWMMIMFLFGCMLFFCEVLIKLLMNYLSYM